jgi:hypothetical protein
MRKLWLTLFIWFCLVHGGLSENIIKELRVEPRDNKIEIIFITQSEKNVQRFIIERSIGSENNFQEIKIFLAKGVPSRYQFIDEWNWMNKFYSSAVYYRIRIEFKDGRSEYSDTAVVLPKVNEIIKTWGNIKLLFR